MATTAGTLEFLQSEYEPFRRYSAEQKTMALEFNTLVRAQLEVPEVPLRQLYVDLLLHDEMLRASQAARDSKRSRIETLMRNKVVLQRRIRQREVAGETATPDPRTEEKELSWSTVLSWFPTSQRAGVQAQLEPVWQNWQAERLSTQEFLAQVVQKCVVLGCRSVAGFRAVFTLIEWVVQRSTQ